ncbi:MAR-binding filament-like protein 1-1 isoform X1 [Prosopis cineraria]|uniref:MAR-binding filament-like protein 1-1 isoform X1 n=1 Tax=Prosopis cineraria TaxID=364024 RepID=UPI00240EB6CF|nr:MAR-binding filament-like protein 1-1 isoform X1 [Prosopis cineraria]
MATSCCLRFELSLFPVSSSQTKSNFRGIRVPMAAASSHQEHSSRRFLRPLGLRPNALVPIKEGEEKTPACSQIQNNEIATQLGRSFLFQPSTSASLGLISFIVGLVSGYAANLKDKAVAYERIEKMGRKLNEKEALILKLVFELSEVSELLKIKRDDEKQKVEPLSRELMTTKEDLQKSQAKLQSACHELRAALKDSAMMQKKLDCVQKKLKTSVKDLNVEKMLVASLKDDVQLLQSQMVKEIQVRRYFELNLKEAAKSVEVMYQKAMTLSDKLKRFNSRIASLEGERERLHKLLKDEKRTSTQTQKNLEDAQNQIMKLEQERENLESKANKLEEELASAQGCEIIEHQESEVAGNEG